MARSFPLACLLLVSVCAFAHEPYVDIEDRLTPEQRRATGLDTLTPAQLKLLNEMLREERAAEVATTPATPATPAATAAPAVPATLAEPPAAAAAPQPHPHPQVGLIEGPIHSRLKGTVSGWQPGTVFELENGQRWVVLKGEARLDAPLVTPDVLVVSGIAGRWFLQVHEDLPKARVYLDD